MRTRFFTPLFTSAAVVAGAIFSPIVHAQDATPSPASTAAAEPVAPATPRPPKKPVAPGVPVAPASPAASATPTAAAQIALAKAAVDDLVAAVDYQTNQAKRVEARGTIAAGQLGEISRARERVGDLVKLQIGRVQKAGAAYDAGTGTLDALVEEIVALRRVASEGGDSISEVRTHDDPTEDTLQEIAGCFTAISEKADAFAEKLADAGEESEGHELEISLGHNGGVHMHSNGDDRVSYGHPVEVKDGETVNDAVAIGAPVTVNGHVRGSAVAIGGDVLVGKTGRVDGDASAVGGHITVEDGGHIEGEQVSLGAGAAGALLAQFARPPEAPRPLPTRIGVRLFSAAAEFLCFFLLGLLTITVIPRRVEVISEALAAHPIKSGGFGVLASFVIFPLTFLLCIILIGIPFVPVLWLGYLVCGFVGYVALALLIGRRLPVKTALTSTATLAAGAGLIVAVGIVPVLGAMIWFFAGFFALGAALMTRFGQDRNGQSTTTTTVPGGLSSIA